MGSKGADTYPVLRLWLYIFVHFLTLQLFYGCLNIGLQALNA